VGWYGQLKALDQARSAQTPTEGQSYQRLLGEAGFHVYYIQLRGFGKSTHVHEPPPSSWYPMWAENVYQFARALGVERFTYTGISHGAGVGWQPCHGPPRGVAGVHLGRGRAARSLDASHARHRRRWASTAADVRGPDE